MVAPTAVNSMESPKQTVANRGLTVIFIAGDTITEIDTEDIQVPVVPVIVYSVVTEGLAITIEPLVALNPIEGLQ